jgi:hypothetical protein
MVKGGIESLTVRTKSSRAAGNAPANGQRFSSEFVSLTVVTSAASRHRIAHARDWLHARQPAEEVLIIGATLGAANELTRDLAQEKRASFSYHRLTLGQLVSRRFLDLRERSRGGDVQAAAQSVKCGL